MASPIGLYIHVPFCLRKCPYCDFYSVIMDDSLADAYCDALVRAIHHCGRHNVRTIYFGGGTPSLPGANRLARLMRTIRGYFHVTSYPEATIEANPAADTDFAALRRAGFNRVSVGVQSCVDSELQALGRLHTADEAIKTIERAAFEGFDDISADLMLAIPGQTEETLVHSIKTITELPIRHISAYLLKIEDGTPFARQNIAAKCPGEDETARLYLRCVEYLAQQRFDQYEISNFGKRFWKGNAVSYHNLGYWNCGEYLGLGPAAHSFLNGRRFFFPRDLESFIDAENPLTLTVDDGPGGGFEEYAMLRLRLVAGLDLPLCAKAFGENINTEAIAQKARSLERNRLLSLKDGVISLTPEGFLLSNAVTAELLSPVTAL